MAEVDPRSVADIYLWASDARLGVVLVIVALVRVLIVVVRCRSGGPAVSQSHGRRLVSRGFCAGEPRKTAGFFKKPHSLAVEKMQTSWLISG